jgi:splicing factor 3B subunit 3
LTISSPLEAHKNETILFSVCGVDVGFDNPIFAMIELEYTEADQDYTGEAAQEVEKKLTYYELDLGLNHVVRKWSEPISRTANFLLSVPGGDVGPSGVLICGENWVGYKHQGHMEVRTPLPRRYDLPPERGVLITCGTIHKLKNTFFFLLQSEFGDLYKVTLELDPQNSKTVLDVVVLVFDTIQSSTSLCILKSGLLFTPSEFGNHALFQFQGIDDPNAEKSGRLLDGSLNESLGDDSVSAASVAKVFKASSKLQNLVMTDDVNSLAPITDMLVEDFNNDGSPHIFTLCGKGNRSTLRVLKRGVSITEVAKSELPGLPTAVWTVKKSNDDVYDNYIVVSFTNATLVLSIGDNVEEVTDSGFLATTATLQVALLADNALIQVHSNGIRHIRPDQRTSEWKTPGKRLIQLAAVNSRQVAITLSGGDIIYFELDDAGQLMELGSIDMGKEVSALDLGVVPKGKARSLFLAVGCWDDTVQLLSLDPSDILGKGPAFPVDSRPTSLCLIEMTKIVEAPAIASKVTTTSALNVVAAPITITSLYLNIGLENGVLHRVAIDYNTGEKSDTRKKFLGAKAVKLCRVTIQGQSSAFALTRVPWLLYNFQNRYHQDPVCYEMLEHASDFSSEACTNGIVAVAGNSLRIFTIDNLGDMFNQRKVPLRYTPRKMYSLKETSELVIVETDHNEFNEQEKIQVENSIVKRPEDKQKKTDEDGGATEEFEGTVIPVRGPVPAHEGKWASCIRIVDIASADYATKSILELTNNKAAFSVCSCRFSQHSEELFIVVGVCTNLTLHPRKFTSCSLNVYRLINGQLTLIHETPVDDVPMCMIEFNGKLLVGVGKVLRLYDLGKVKLLRKCENKSFPSAIVRLQTFGDRIFVGDISESVFFVKFKRSESSTLTIFADDITPRFVYFY